MEVVLVKGGGIEGLVDDAAGFLNPTGGSTTDTENTVNGEFGLLHTRKIYVCLGWWSLSKQ
jgi:hypothetical protein